MFNIPGSNDILQKLMALNIDKVPTENFPVEEEMSFYDKLNKAVSNPNTIRAFAQLAQSLGQGKNFAEASGGAADMTARNIASQKAGSKASQQNLDMEQIIKAIQGGDFFTPKGEAGPTAVTINQDGMTLKLDRTKPAQKSPFETDMPLEADTGGVDLRGFY